MYSKTFFAGLMLAMSFSAAAEGQIVSQGYELALTDFRPPVSRNSAVAFKPCVECEYVLSRVGPGTRYTLNGNPVKLRELRKAIARMRNRDSVSIGILRHLESNTIELIDVTQPTTQDSRPGS